MNSVKIRSGIKTITPSSVRWLMRGVFHFAQRLGRWLIILWQVRGERWRDSLHLVLSALAAPIVSLRKLQQWQDPVLLFDTRVAVRGIGRFHLRARCDDLWHVVPWREKAIFDELKASVRSGDIFVDAGANIGIYTILAARLVGSTGRVIAIEMMSDTADRLALHCRINDVDNVVLLQQALSDTAGVIVRASVVDGKFGQATITDRGLGSAVRKVEVVTTTLDEATSVCDRVRVLKMDLEGAEHEALRGASRLLARTDRVIYESRGFDREEPIDLIDEEMRRAGFELTSLDGNNRLAVRPGTEGGFR